MLDEYFQTAFVFSFSGKPIFSVDIHPDGTKFATGGQGEKSNPLTYIFL